jgi:protease-4
MGLFTYGAWKLKGAESLQHSLESVLVKAMNEQRRRQKDLDYLVFNLPSSIAALPAHVPFWQRQFFGEPPLSLAEIELAFRRIEKDARVRGVILTLPRLAVSLADVQSLRAAILHLREGGKSVICFSVGYDTLSYYLASAADQILLQTGGSLQTLGLQNSITFMRDGLAAIGIEIDSIAISPYKSAADRFTHQEITPELRAQIEWLMDSTFHEVLKGIAEGRGCTLEEAQTFIDCAPYTDEAALEAGYIDGVLTEEGLPAHLGTAHLVPWEEAESKVFLQTPPQRQKVVAVLPLEGLIIDGESANPPDGIPIPVVGADRIGSVTVVQQIRNLMKDEQVAALVLFINSGGGSATASEAMASALDELAKTRPVVVYMHSVAASGGYYISTPAQWIVAQPATLTGSIGVIMGKVVNNDLLKKLRFNAVDFQRGQNASLESSHNAFSDLQRDQIKVGILRTYDQFIQRVATSRDMTPEAVETVSSGRVWTGAQALEHGLVDQLGGLTDAVIKARELAQLPNDAPAILVHGKLKPLGPQLAEQVNPAASLRYGVENLYLMMNGQAQYLLPWSWH